MDKEKFGQIVRCFFRCRTAPGCIPRRTDRSPVTCTDTGTDPVGAHLVERNRLVAQNRFIRANDKVIVSEPEPEPVVLRPEALGVPILFEDDHLLVINKPAGMTVHPGAGNQSGTLVNALLHQVSNLSGIGGELRPGVIHRLDKETSGCLVVAKHDLAHLRLSNQFAQTPSSRNFTWRCAPDDSRS